MAQDNTQDNGAKQKARASIAKWVILGSMLGFVAVSAIMLIFAAPGEKQAAAAEKIFTMFVPLLGTWIGAVVAYYFSGDAYDKAHQSMSDLVKQVTEEKLASIPVRREMIPKHSITYVKLQKGDSGKGVKLKDMIEKLKPPITRLPVLDDKEIVKYIVHQSLIFKFIADKTFEDPSYDAKVATFEDFLKHKDMKEQVSKTFAFVSIDSSLADAKKKMEAVANCQDVFVTEDGTKDKPIQGWLTNIDLARHLKV